MKGYFKDSSLGTNLTIEKIGNIEYENTNIKVDDNKSFKIRDMTLQRKGIAHMIVYYVGEPVEKFGGKLPENNILLGVMMNHHGTQVPFETYFGL